MFYSVHYRIKKLNKHKKYQVRDQQHPETKPQGQSKPSPSEANGTLSRKPARSERTSWI